MKKFTLAVVIVAVVTLALGSVGVAFAQTPTQTTEIGAGWMGGRGTRGAMVGGNSVARDGILHDYMIAEYAEALGIPVADLEARLDGGETMAEIALSEGLTFEQFRTLLVDVRTQAIEQALSDGVLTQEQADWLTLRGAGQMGFARGMHGGGQGQFANPACPYYNQTNP